MSQLTNHGENQLADFMRGQGLTLPDSWFLALGSAASDSSFTELIGPARQEVERTLANFAGTQGAGTTLPSTGTSHASSNNIEIDWGIALSAWGTANAVGFFDSATDGECWMWFALPSPLVIAEGDLVLIAPGAMTFALGLPGGMSDYLANKLIDKLVRGETYDWPASTYAALYTGAPTNAGGGIEVGAGGYARVEIASTMDAWSGTQGDGTTDPSSGTAGWISNNEEFSYPPIAADWGVVSHEGLRDAATLGNLLFWAPLASPKSVPAGGTPPRHAVGTMGITIS